MEQIPDVTSYAGLGISVLAGLLAVLILSFGRLIWQKIGENLWLKLAWRHLPDISGEWKSERVNKQTYWYEETMSINQNGWRISGEMEYREHSLPDDAITNKKIFRFEGHFKERVLAVLYASKNRKSLSTGSTLLFLQDDDTLAGGCVYYDPGAREVTTDKYMWKRVLR